MEGEGGEKKGKKKIGKDSSGGYINTGKSEKWHMRQVDGMVV